MAAEVHTNEPLMFKPSASEVNIAIKKFIR